MRFASRRFTSLLGGPLRGAAGLSASMLSGPAVRRCSALRCLAVPRCGGAQCFNARRSRGAAVPGASMLGGPAARRWLGASRRLRFAVNHEAPTPSYGLEFSPTFLYAFVCVFCLYRIRMMPPSCQALYDVVGDLCLSKRVQGCSREERTTFFWVFCIMDTREGRTMDHCCTPGPFC